MPSPPATACLPRARPVPRCWRRQGRILHAKDAPKKAQPNIDVLQHARASDGGFSEWCALGLLGERVGGKRGVRGREGGSQE